MGVPGHDERDNEFAEKLGLEIIPVVIPAEYQTDEENLHFRNAQKKTNVFGRRIFCKF